MYIIEYKTKLLFFTSICAW